MLACIASLRAFNSGTAREQHDLEHEGYSKQIMVHTPRLRGVQHGNLHSIAKGAPVRQLACSTQLP